jgi:cytochrome c-type biogenesis protein CcmH/NrfG
MRLQSLLFLIIGFAVGYGVVFTWTKEKAPELVRTTVRPLFDQSAMDARPKPPLDMALVQRLQDRLKENPADFEALRELGNIHFDQENFGEAISWYTRALKVKPNEANVLTDLGTAYYYSDRFENAIAEFNKALALDPSHSQALFNLGVALVQSRNDVDGAIRSWETLIATNPNDPRIGMVKEQLEKLKERQKK